MNIDFAEVVLDYELSSSRFTPDGNYWDKVFVKDDLYISVVFYPNGKIEHLRFYKGVFWHRPPAEGPADTMYYPNGNISYLMFYEDNLKHRPRHLGPAFMEYNKDGSIFDEIYIEYDVIL